MNVEPGADQTFTFTPNQNYDLSSIEINGVELSPEVFFQHFFTQSYTFQAVAADHTIAVYFNEGGPQTVGTGPQSIFPATGSALIANIAQGGTASGNEIPITPDIDPSDVYLVLWYMTWDYVVVENTLTTVAIQYDEDDLPEGYDETLLR